MKDKQKKCTKRIALGILAMLAVSTVGFAYAKTNLSLIAKATKQKEMSAKEQIAVENLEMSENPNKLFKLEKIAEEDRLQNTENTTYIYDEQDLVELRDKVNAGDNLAGKTIYLMSDIDLSTICSAEIGSWVPISHTIEFAGNFNGNYHVINGLYINSGSYTCEGLFGKISTQGKVENLILEDVNITNTYNTTNTDIYTGALVGYNKGTVKNIGVQNGSVTGRKTAVNYTANSWPGARTGGVVGYNWNGEVSGCYNKANVASYAPTANSYNELYAGGVVAGNFGKMENCYNRGNVTGNSYGAYIGGTAGSIAITSGTRRIF